MSNPSAARKNLYQILKPLVSVFSKLKFNFRPKKINDIEGPFVVISNHVTNYDMFFVASSFKEHMYFVVSEHSMRAGFLSKLLTFFFAPIIRKKATVGGATVMNMRKMLKEGNNICLFAEGERSGSGRSKPIPEATGAVIRLLGAKLVTYRLHGGYLTSPRWSKNLRRGKMEGEIVNVYTPEQLKKMQPEEIQECINRDIFVDAFVHNSKEKVEFKGKDIAENIEFELVVCPNCKRLGTIASRGSEFFCDCGLHGTYNNYGEISGTGFPFRTIAEWDTWEREFIDALPDIDNDEILVSDENQFLNQIGDDHSVCVRDKGRLTLSRRGITVGKTLLPLNSISRYDTILHGYLLISMADGTYYEIRNAKHKFAGYLYILVLNRLKRVKEA